MTDIFETILGADQVEDAAKQTLIAWMPTYLREIELQRNLTEGRIPAPKTYTSRNRFTTFPDDRMPICVVVSPGIVDAPHKDGEGIHSAWWGLGVGIVARAATTDESNMLSKVYGSAARAILLQKQVGDLSDDVQWVDESYDDIPDDDQSRTIRSAQVIFRVHVDGIVSDQGGPAYPIPPDPDNQPGSDWPEFQTVKIDSIEVEEVP